jgi:hypothetical protein
MTVVLFRSFENRRPAAPECPHHVRRDAPAQGHCPAEMIAGKPCYLEQSGPLGRRSDLQ